MREGYSELPSSCIRSDFYILSRVFDILRYVKKDILNFTCNINFHKGGIQMNTISKKISSYTALRMLGFLALCSAFIGANSSCVFCYHNPEKPEALKKLKKI